MKKVFISQPMAGKTEDEILEQRSKVIRVIKDKYSDAEIIDSYAPDEEMEPLQYLAESIRLLADADMAYFASGWAMSRGCRIEHECAKEYDIPIIPTLY